MSGIEEGREELYERASILREYAGELHRVRGAESSDIFFCPDAEREAFLASEPTGYHTTLTALAWYVDRAGVISTETQARFAQLSEQNAPGNSVLPGKLDPYREKLQQQYEKITGIAHDLVECLEKAAAITGYLENHAGVTALVVSTELEVELLQRAQAAEQDADSL